MICLVCTNEGNVKARKRDKVFPFMDLHCRGFWLIHHAVVTWPWLWLFSVFMDMKWSCKLYVYNSMLVSVLSGLGFFFFLFLNLQHSSYWTWFVLSFFYTTLLFQRKCSLGTSIHSSTAVWYIVGWSKSAFQKQDNTPQNLNIFNKTAIHL